MDLTGYVNKDVFDSKASEAAKLSKQLKEKMTDDEAAKAAEDAAKAELETKYTELLKKSTVAEHTAKFLALGYDEKLAHDTAEALFGGDMDKVFANQQTFNAGREKALKAEILKSTPGPEGGDEGGPGEKPLGVQVAEKIGKANADANKSANDIINMYTGGNQ